MPTKTKPAVGDHDHHPLSDHQHDQALVTVTTGGFAMVTGLLVLARALGGVPILAEVAAMVTGAVMFMASGAVEIDAHWIRSSGRGYGSGSGRYGSGYGRLYFCATLVWFLRQN